MGNHFCALIDLSKMEISWKSIFLFFNISLIFVKQIESYSKAIVIWSLVIAIEGRSKQQKEFNLMFASILKWKLLWIFYFLIDQIACRCLSPPAYFCLWILAFIGLSIVLSKSYKPYISNLGSNDPDDLIVRAFKAYEVEGKIEAEMFRHALMNFGDKFSKAEVDDIFGEFEVDDDGFIESKSVIGLFVAGGGEEKKEEEKKEEAAEAPAEGGEGDGGDAGGDGGKKKKKKKKAAK